MKPFGDVHCGVTRGGIHVKNDTVLVLSEDAWHVVLKHWSQNVLNEHVRTHLSLF